MERTRSPPRLAQGYGRHGQGHRRIARSTSLGEMGPSGTQWQPLAPSPEPDPWVLRHEVELHIDSLAK